MFEFTSAAGEEVRNALGAPTPPPPFRWHDPAALTDLFAPYGLAVAVEERTLAFDDISATSYLDLETRNHPIAVSGFAVLEAAGRAEPARQRLLEILQAGNEDSSAFRTTSTYVIATCRRTGSA
jgi:hypothetical protein